MGRSTGCEAWRPELKLHPQNTRDSVSTAGWEKLETSLEAPGSASQCVHLVAELARKTLHSEVEGENQLQNHAF